MHEDGIKNGSNNYNDGVTIPVLTSLLVVMYVFTGDRVGLLLMYFTRSLGAYRLPN